MKGLIGTHDLLFVTFDTLRYDVAAELAAAGRTPNLANVLPGGQWERRHTPASFTYAAHQAFFAGFLPTPTTPGPHPRRFAAAFPGSESTTDDTWVFDAPDLVTALRDVGYRTVCVGGVGFFNPESALGRVLPGLFAEAHWEPAFGVTNPACFEAQLDRIETVTAELDRDRPLFLFVNVAAVHQPNRHYVSGAGHDSRETHAAALEYVDAHLPRLFDAVTGRNRSVAAILTSDHGTAYGEGGHTGHRVAHEVVWTVPYAEVVLP
ncbi:STM4013/SEN3800 family hydrolase [Cryptosporangium sp. NPDC048952]|uniref:STM4013/SEN3800 family hydrolase n=1 Tax=Cryptosporangium sp. NPDC048952 TaxID=3363961 RepID=UPI003721A9FC